MVKKPSRFILKTISMLIIALLMVPSVVSAADGGSGPGHTTRTPIKHLITIMMENHSFDNIFGKYPYSSNISSRTMNLSVPNDLLDLNHLPSGLSPVAPGTFATPDPTEGYGAYHTDWNNGLMNNFVNGSGQQSMSYFTASQMGPEWDIAQQFAIGDYYFSSELSETLPNRLYSLAGFTPVKQDSGPPPYVPASQTIFNELSNYNVSWAYYFLHPSPTSYPLNSIQGMSKYSANIQSWANFTSQVQSGTLPSVTWLSDLGGGASGFSQHPSDNVLTGEIWLLSVINMLMRSPVWNSSAIFITYDEGGGYYDHVPPPRVDGHLLGFRVPFIVVSPFAKEDYVSGTLLNHASMLAFIDYNWNMPALNQFVLDSNIPLDFFYFNQTRSPELFNFGASLQIPGLTSITLSAGNGYSNVSSLYPVLPQMSYHSLPYRRYGNSSFNLSQINSSVFVKSNSGYDGPVDLYLAIVVGITATLILAVAIIVKTRHSSK
ncbi:MAG: alkaline phosphatase family protein [Thermoplasmataceae archaeon]